MSQSIKNFLIGIFVIVACGFIISIVLFLRPSVGDGKETLYVRFSNINQISVGTRVLFAGMPVGEVVAIEEIHDARSLPTDAEGDVYFYQLTLKIDSSIKIYTTDEISIQTSGLLGEKSIGIVPKAPPPGVKSEIIGTQPIYADSQDPIQNTFHQLGDLAKKIEGAVDGFQNWLCENGDNLAFAVKSFGCAMDQVYVTVADINEQRIVDEVKGAVQNFNLSMIKIQGALQQMDDNHTFKNVGIMMQNLKHTTHSLDLITRDIAEGKGTIGRLIKSDEMYLRFTAILSKVDTLMNDVNHYGLLFHLNKSWQRLRTQRVNLMNALKSPSEFRHFFEQEIDQINTSMARLSELIQKAEDSPERKEIMKSTPFKRDFGELLREVDELGDNLRLYNQQLMDSTGDSPPVSQVEICN